MNRAIVLDITHLTSRRQARPHTGIDRVDIAIARMVSEGGAGQVLGLHAGLLGAKVVTRSHIASLVAGPTTASSEVDQDALLKEEIRSWIRTPDTGQKPAVPMARRRAGEAPFLRQQAWRLLHSNRGLTIPEEAIYLNAAPYGTPVNDYRWLDRRTDVKAVFFVHDLLPIDHPEFFPPQWQPTFRQMVSFVMRRADALIVASEVTRARVELELRRHPARKVAVVVAPLAAPPPFCREAAPDETLRQHPYFVMCSTIEPRKNHRTVLNVWQQLLRDNPSTTPALVLIGKRGWKDEAVAAMLDGSTNLRSRVLEVSAASDRVLHWLLSNAAAALMPSFAEGYGLPIVEALSLGVPIIASDMPLFREVSQGRATFCDPHMPEEWVRSICALTDRSGPSWKNASLQARAFRRPTTAVFSKRISELLGAL